MATGSLAYVKQPGSAIRWHVLPTQIGATVNVKAFIAARVDDGTVVYTGVCDNLKSRLGFRVYNNGKQDRLYNEFRQNVGAELAIYATVATGGSDDARRAALVAKYGSKGNVRPSTPDAADDVAATPALDLDAIGAAYPDPSPAVDASSEDDGGDMPDAAVLAAGILDFLPGEAPSASDAVIAELAELTVNPIGKRSGKHGKRS